MKILLSNDDGVMAEGIKALTIELSKEHEVYVVAPDRERSAAGHSLTLHTPIRVEELDSKFGAKRIWITSGTPGDCVKIGINAILSDEEKPDLIINIIDATSINRKSRRLIFSNLKVDCNKICYVIDTPLEKCIERLHKRNASSYPHKIDESVLHKYHQSFQRPTKDEGFDEIIIETTN